MTDQSEPREWWISPEERWEYMLRGTAMTHPPKDKKASLIHVIEKRAYNSLVESMILAKKQRDAFEVERDQLRAEIKDLKQRLFDKGDIALRDKELLAQANALAEALDVVRSNITGPGIDLSNPFIHESLNACKEALKQWNKWRDKNANSTTK